MRKAVLIAAWVSLFGAVSAEAVVDVLHSPITLSTTTGLGTAIALDNQNTIHVSYYDPEDQKVKYMKRVNGEAVWRSTQAVDSLNHTHSTGTAMALDVNRRPHVVFYDEDDQALKYSRFNGTTWATATSPIEIFASTGPFASLVLNSAGNPRVLYSNAETSSTKMGISNDGGVTWSTFTVVQATMVAPGGIAVDSTGRALVALNLYIDFDVDGSSEHVVGLGREISPDSGLFQGPISIAVGPESTTPGRVSLALDSNDVAHFSVFDEDDLDLWYVTGTTSSVTLTTVPVTGDVRPDSAIVLTAQGRPRIAFFEEGVGLRVARCDANCDTTGGWSTPAAQILDGAVDDGAGVSLTRNSLNSFFAAYFDGGVPQLRFATNAERGLTISGTVRDVAAAPMSGVTVSLTGNIASDSMTTSGAGTYAFGDLLEGSYGVIPSLTGYGFQPVPAVFSPLTSSEVWDFTGGEVGFSQLDNLIDPTRGEEVSMTVSVLDGRVFVGVYALNGRLVKILLDEPKTIGAYPVSWDGRNDGGEIVASGIYLVRVESAGFKKIEKVAVVK